MNRCEVDLLPPADVASPYVVFVLPNDPPCAAFPLSKVAFNIPGVARRNENTY